MTKEDFKKPREGEKMSKKKQNLNYKVLTSIEELEDFLNNEENKESE